MREVKDLDAVAREHADQLYTKYAEVRPEVLESEYVAPMMTTSLRLPAETHKAVRAAAKRAGVRPAVLIRSWIEAGLAGQTTAGTIPVAELEELITRHRTAS